MKSRRFSFPTSRNLSRKRQDYQFTVGTFNFSSHTTKQVLNLSLRQYKVKSLQLPHKLSQLLTCKFRSTTGRNISKKSRVGSCDVVGDCFIHGTSIGLSARTETHRCADERATGRRSQDVHHHFFPTNTLSFLKKYSSVFQKSPPLLETRKTVWKKSDRMSYKHYSIVVSLRMHLLVQRVRHSHFRSE